MNLVWRYFTVILTSALLLTAQQAMAQAGGTTESGGTANTYFKTYAREIEQGSGPEKVQRLANLQLLRVALASLPTAEQSKTPVIVFGVPAISSTKRLPDTVPTDGLAGRMIPAVAAKGEYTPLSFVVAPLKDISKLEVRATDLVSQSQKIPASAVDIKVIKVWYQTGTAWHSYFADATHRVLVPELLLNDENLIHVDTKTQDNYLRVDYPGASKYLWISAPPDIDNGHFNHCLEPVADSPKLLPVALYKGQTKQFWVTIHVPDQAKAGIYQGHIELLDQGQVIARLPMTLRVLPFELPMPRTYYDLEKPFYSTIYNGAQLVAHLQQSGGNWELSEAKLRAELKDLRQHNVFNQMLRGLRTLNSDDEKILKRNLELIKEAGFVSPLFGGFTAAGSLWFPKDRNPVRYERYLGDVKTTLVLMKKILGPWSVYMFGSDEPSMTILLTEQDGWRDLHQLGVKIYSTSKNTHYPAVGFAEDIANYSGNVSREDSIKWHMINGSIMNYAGPHTGPENPEFNRRFHGLQLYKAMYDGTGNYIYFDQSKVWNDFASTIFRGFNMVYPTQTGVIDTMAWEGFRTAIDDVRYATLLKQLASEAITSKDVYVAYAGKKALLWLELTDPKNGDLTATRMEMVHYILELRRYLGKGEL